ncbi:FecR domain-containing protein [Ideonella sp. DXS29W]|uniref:FecR domain-containing protein n=1 Tax=Ideonella lacteola TaxID=2984193 RepID=A0ABU9BLS0_9BURK
MLQHRFVAVAALAVTCSLRAAPAEVLDYRIEPGDTFIGVTERLLRPGTRWQQLQRANPGMQPLRLPPGRTLRIPAQLLQETAEMAEVMHAHGSVTLERAGAPPVALAGGERLRRGDRVRTGAQSSSTLRFADGARVLVRPLSDLTIDKTVRWGQGGPVQTELGLDAGSADSLVPPAAGPAQPTRFRIRTPVANLGVRGTEFRTSAERDRTRLEVLQGTVALRPGASASGGERRARPAADLPVAAGFGAIASPQQATPPQPLLGPPDLTPTPSRLERMPVSLGWPALAGASSYRAQVFDAAGTEVLRLDGRFDQPQARWPDDLPDGAYELRVRGVAAGGLEGRDARHPFKLKARPEPPLLNTPAADARLASPSIDFSWTRNPQAARYRLQVADDAAFGTPRIDRDDLSATGASLELPEGTHWWRLASVRADGDQGPWGDAQRVTRVPQPPPPPPEPPESTDSGMKLRWGAGAPGTRYQVQVSRDPSFAAVLHDERVEQPSWLLPKPEPGRYLVRVRSIDAEGFEGPFGTPQEIEVQRSLWWLMLLPLVLLL